MFNKRMFFAILGLCSITWGLIAFCCPEGEGPEYEKYIYAPYKQHTNTKWEERKKIMRQFRLGRYDKNSLISKLPKEMIRRFKY